MKDKYWEVIFDTVALSALTWVLVHLVLVLIHGKFYIYEGNPWILWAEIAYTSLAIILGLVRTALDIKHGRPVR